MGRLNFISSNRPGLIFVGFLFLMTLGQLSACESITGVADENEEPISELPPPVVDTPAAGSMRVVGYHPWWLGPSWLTYDLSLFDGLYFFELPINADGSITDRHGWPYLWTDLIETATEQGLPITQTVTILDTETYISVFSNPDRITRLLKELVDLSASGSVAGLHLDIEAFDPAPPELRDVFSWFVETLAQELKQRRPDFELSLFMLALDESDNYDEARLAAAVDFVIVQGYDLHWIGDTVAGPIASLSGWGDRNWTSILQRMTGLGIERSKMIFSVPYYGYEWATEGPEPGSRTTEMGEMAPYAPSLIGFHSARDRALEFGKLRDPEGGSPYYVFEDSTGWHQGWFEDDESLSQKYRFVQSEGLGGVAVFPIGYGDETLDAALRLARLEFIAANTNTN